MAKLTKINNIPSVTIADVLKAVNDKTDNQAIIIANEKTERINADNILQNELNNVNNELQNEATERINADNILQNELNNVNNELLNAIDTETAERINADANLQANLDNITNNLQNEATERINADAILQNTKLTAPQPTNDGIRSIIAKQGNIGWHNVDTIAPNSLITEPYLTQRLKQIESVNFLGIIEFAGNGTPNIDTALQDDLYMDYENNILYKYDGTQWNAVNNVTTPTTGDFYDINIFVDFDENSGTITWVHNVNDTNYYWYYRVDNTGETNLEVTTDNISVNKNNNQQLQIKEFSNIPNDSFITKTNGNIGSILLNSKANTTDLNTEITNRTNADNNLQTQINNIKQFITYKAKDEASGLAYSQANPNVFVYWEE